MIPSKTTMDNLISYFFNLDRIIDHNDGQKEIMKSLQELTYNERNLPCIEYPGFWIIIIDGKPLGYFNYPKHANPFQSAKKVAEGALNGNIPQEILLKWKCSKRDPRQNYNFFVRSYIWGRLTINGWVRKEKR